MPITASLVLYQTTVIPKNEQFKTSKILLSCMCRLADWECFLFINFLFVNCRQRICVTVTRMKSSMEDLFQFRACCRI